MIYIYGLYSDNIDNIRYVGKTTNVSKRLKEHINDARRNNTTHRQNWIRSEIKNNKNINIKILEECDEFNWEEKEKYWISQFDNLTNHTIGGEGGCGETFKITYNDAKHIVQKLNIKSSSQWKKLVENNPVDNIPSNPFEYFKNKGEWISWGDFLGTGKIQDNIKALNYIPYNDAKKWIKNNLKVDTIEDWKNLVKIGNIPYFIPNRPERYYSKNTRGWIDWGDFLGTGRLANKNKFFISYVNAKKIISNMSIKSKKHFNDLYNDEIKRYNIPALPCSTYKNKGWISWGDFLGTDKLQDNLKALNYISYNDAKKWIKKNLNINTSQEWFKLVKEEKIPIYIPNHPEIYYRKKNRGWVNWGDFLCTGRLGNKNKQFISYENAKKILNNLRITTAKQYYKEIKGNNQFNLPTTPDIYYKKTKEWINWIDFFSYSRLNN